ncbi:MAG TPA: hypothetical protein VE404_10495 [Verrucomicrobiae bacterium]|nr:hypothetical protein [Verrucomicrobiae bacterium]
MASGEHSVAETIVAQTVPPMPARPKALICKTGPAEALDACMMKLGREVDLEALDTLAEGMERCLEGGVDTLFVNLFSFTARELTAIAAFRSLRPQQEVVAVAGPEMRNAFVDSSLFDDVRIVPTAYEGFNHPRA